MLGDLTAQAVGVRFTWHSLRRGGATARAHRGESADAIRRFGCWNSEKALTHYIFPWSELPLRHWRNSQHHSPASTAANLAAAKPPAKQRRRTTKRAVHDPRGSGNGGFDS